MARGARHIRAATDLVGPVFPQVRHVGPPSEVSCLGIGPRVPMHPIGHVVPMDEGHYLARDATAVMLKVWMLFLLCEFKIRLCFWKASRQGML